MARNIVAIGRTAIRQAASILADDLAGTTSRAALWPGAQWRPDHLLLCVDRESVRFLAGNVLYNEDVDTFLTDEYPAEASFKSGGTGWLRVMGRHEMPFCMSLASTLALGCDDSMSACFFLERFSAFYCGHRTHLEQVARDLPYVLDGLFALQRHAELFEECMNAMGPMTQRHMPKGVSQSDIGSFLGRTLLRKGPEQIVLKNLPSTVRNVRQSAMALSDPVLNGPHYKRVLDSLERYAERALPVIEKVRTDW